MVPLRMLTCVLCALLPLASSASLFEDDFNNGIPGARWLLGGSCAEPVESSGQLIMAKSSGCTGSTSIVLDRTRRPVVGDFDIVVDFALVNFAAPATGDRFAGLQVIRADNSSFVATIERYNRYAAYSNCPPFTTNYKAFTTSSANCGGASVWTSAVGPDGRFRIARQGSMLQMYYWNGAWVELLSRSATADNLCVAIYTATANGDIGAYDVRFDNFRLVDAFRDPCDCDLNDDGVVGLSDIPLFAADYYSGTHPARSDFDGDGTVSLGDIPLIAAAIGTATCL